MIRVCGILVLALSILIAGCSSADKLAASDVVKELQNQGIELSPADAKEEQDFELKGARPHSFKIGKTKEADAVPELISIYMFDSASERDKGADEFARSKHVYSGLQPMLFKYRNTLILYWPQSIVNQSETKFGDMLKSVLEKHS